MMYILVHNVLAMHAQTDACMHRMTPTYPVAILTICHACSGVTCDGTALDHTNAATLASGTEGASEAYSSQIVYTCDAGFTGSLTFTCGDSGFTTSDSCAGRLVDDDDITKCVLHATVYLFARVK
jgi:hypothetical protein